MKRIFTITAACMTAALTACNSGTSADSGVSPGSPPPPTPRTYTSPLTVSYTFDDSVSAAIPDQSGNGVELRVNGCTLEAGKVGKAIHCLEHGNVRTALSCRDRSVADQLAAKGAMTVQFWLKYPSGGWNSYPVLSHDGSFRIYLENQRLHFSPTAPADMVLPQDLAPDTWYNVAISYDTREARFYLNGALIDTQSVISPISHEARGFCALNVGSTDSSVYEASFDNLRIHDAVLSDAEILARYNTDIGL